MDKTKRRQNFLAGLISSLELVKCHRLLNDLCGGQDPGFYTMMESVLTDAEPAVFYENSDRVIQEQTSFILRSHHHRLVILVV